MKKVFALLMLACIGVMADPVSCGMIEEGRVVDKPGCRCAVKNDVIDTVKFRYIVDMCVERAKQYSTLAEFRHKDTKAYMAVLRHGWSDKISWLKRA